MAQVNPERRAEIGRARRARTRAAILEAARACYAAPTAVPVTVDAVVQAAGLAKGTFYVHFRDLVALEAELGATLIASLDERLQPARLAAGHPLGRLATAVTVLLRDLAAEPAQARLAARAPAAMPDVLRTVRARLGEDLAEAHAVGLLGVERSDLAARMVSAMFWQAAEDIGAGRIDGTAVPDVVRAMLRAVGSKPDDAAAHAAHAAYHAETFAKQVTAAGRHEAPREG